MTIAANGIPVLEFEVIVDLTLSRTFDSSDALDG
jgi:hypothetical protein